MMIMCCAGGEFLHSGPWQTAVCERLSSDHTRPALWPGGPQRVSAPSPAASATTRHGVGGWRVELRGWGGWRVELSGWGGGSLVMGGLSRVHRTNKQGS